MDVKQALYILVNLLLVVFGVYFLGVGVVQLVQDIQRGDLPPPADFASTLPYFPAVKDAKGATGALASAQAERISSLYGLHPQPWLSQTFNGEGSLIMEAEGLTAAILLLTRSEHFRWHKIAATELWHHYSGAPVEVTLLSLSESDSETTSNGVHTETLVLAGPQFLPRFPRSQPMISIPPNTWVAARPMETNQYEKDQHDIFSLVGFTVSPGFGDATDVTPASPADLADFPIELVRRAAFTVDRESRVEVEGMSKRKEL